MSAETIVTKMPLCDTCKAMKMPCQFVQASSFVEGAGNTEANIQRLNSQLAGFRALGCPYLKDGEDIMKKS